MDFKKIIRNFILAAIIFFMLCAALVIVIDPFFHYHKPVGGLKAVLTEKEYQCVGSIKNFDYDTVIAGSSVCENYNNAWFDEKFGVTSIKAIRSYGSIADLSYFLDLSYEDHDLRYVFFNVDPIALANEAKVSFEDTGCPMYLYDDDLLNDVQYLLNKDVLLKKIPFMILKSYVDEYDEGESYNWARWKSFGTDVALSQYARLDSAKEMHPENYYETDCEKNIAFLSDLVEAHPETEFMFFFSPYSFLWWDNLTMYGETESYLYDMRMFMDRMLEYDNVRICYFMNDESIVSDLDNYMDVLHFTPDINRFICDNLDNDDYRVSKENVDEIFEKTRRYAYEQTPLLIEKYKDRINTESLLD